MIVSVLSFWGPVALAVGLLFSCESQSPGEVWEEYEGPTVEMYQVNTLVIDSLIPFMLLRAPVQWVFKNSDREWPQGVYLEFYGPDGEPPEVTFQSDRASFDAVSRLYKGEGNVRVLDMKSGDRLNTEELYWDPDEKIYYTDRTVSIISDGEVHTGKGMTAKQGGSSYEIKNPSGIMSIEESESAPPGQ